MSPQARPALPATAAATSMRVHCPMAGLLQPSDRLGDRRVPVHDLELRPDAAPGGEQRVQHGGDVVARDGAVLVGPHPHGPGAGLVSQPSRPHDRPVEVLVAAHGGVGFALGAQVDLKHVVGVRVEAVGPARRDDDVAANAGLHGRVGEQDRPVAVEGELALGPAVRPGPSGEHDGVGPGDGFGDHRVVVTLEVDDDGARPV